MWFEFMWWLKLVLELGVLLELFWCWEGDRRESQSSRIRPGAHISQGPLSLNTGPWSGAALQLQLLPFASTPADPGPEATPWGRRLHLVPGKRYGDMRNPRQGGGALL